jgi:hypothetical protein
MSRLSLNTERKLSTLVIENFVNEIEKTLRIDNNNSSVRTVTIGRISKDLTDLRSIDFTSVSAHIVSRVYNMITEIKSNWIFMGWSNTGMDETYGRGFRSYQYGNFYYIKEAS